MIREIFGFGGDGVILGVRVSPFVALLCRFFFGQGEVLLSDGLVVGEGREFWWEEFAVGVGAAFGVHVGHVGHVLYDLGNQCFVLLSGVLFV